MSNWNERGPRSETADLRALPNVNRPLDVSDEEYEAKLWAETDASLRRDPERWVIKAVGDQSWSTAARGGATEERGLRAYVENADDLAAARAEEYRETGRRKRAADAARSVRAQAGALRGWETRRARQEAAARTQAELG